MTNLTLLPMLEDRVRRDGEYQHIIPQFFLKKFSCNSDEETIWEYSLRDQTCGLEPQLISGLAGRPNIYDVYLDYCSHQSAEGLLGKNFENHAAPIITKIITRGSALGLSTGQKEKLSNFFGVQYARTTKWTDLIAENKISESDTQNYLELRARSNPGLMQVIVINQNYYNLVRSYGLTQGKLLGEDIKSRKWIVLNNSTGKQFLLGDNPLVPWNFEIDMTEEFGFTDEKTVLSFPLTPTKALIMLHQSEYEKAVAKNVEFSTGAVNATLDNVDTLNYLQLVKADQYIYSSTNDFSYVDEQYRLRPNLLESVLTKPRPISESDWEKIKPLLVSIAPD